MLYVQIAGCVVSGVQSIMYYCGSAGAPSGRLRGSRDVTAGGAGIENFMRIISAMADDTGIRLINFGHWVQYLTCLLSGTPLLIMRCDISLCMRSQDPGAASTTGEARASRSAAQQVESFIISSLREDNFFKHSI